MSQVKIIKEEGWQTKDTVWGPVTFRIDKNMPDYGKYPYFRKKAEKAKKTFSQIPGFTPLPSPSE